MKLGSLIKDRPLARKMAWRNYEVVANGMCSIHQRNKLLAKVYDEAFLHPSSEALSPKGLPWFRNRHLTAMTDAEIAADRRAYRSEIGLTSRHLVL